jgi:hypothetical protein
MKQVIGSNNMVVRRNGWIYIYLSNESTQEVYFDSLVVNFRHRPLIEQKDYYAFGLEISFTGAPPLGMQNESDNTALKLKIPSLHKII